MAGKFCGKNTLCLKMLSLSFKCEFYRPEHNAKGGPMKMSFEGLKIQKNEIYQRIEFTV